jgi:hypothetical protein
MVVGALRIHARQHSENLFATVSHKFGGMSVATIEVGATVTLAVAVNQLLQQDAAHLMHGHADRHFAGFQVQVSQALAILQHASNEAVYFLFRFSVKCLRSFFSTAPTHFHPRWCGLDATDRSGR